jgi:hypothetical protein
MQKTARTGRSRSLPPAIWSEVFRLYSLGLGYQSIANALWQQGIYSSRGSVERLVKGRGAYRGRRVVKKPATISPQQPSRQ